MESSEALSREDLDLGLIVWEVACMCQMLQYSVL
jgi:hypothetical protein